ncbi:cell wall anchor protein [Pararobbsia silviterrae]|uniref:Cell wall anchor protein n=2 Tax=Pararobbsia silviterrae TaxID=1792498 RepID=A0A494YBP6_9BURK|nr:cell wall anchor protein [Pararobbsia silviterrae]
MTIAGAAQANGWSDPYLYNGTEVAQSVWVTGFFGIYGCVSVDDSAGAVVNNTQTADLNHVKMSPTAQNYQKGAITTTYNETSAWNNVADTGNSWLNTKSSSSSSINASYKASQSESQSNYASINAYGGYGYKTSSGTFNTTYNAAQAQAQAGIVGGVAAGYQTNSGYSWPNGSWGELTAGIIGGVSVWGEGSVATQSGTSNKAWGSGSGYLYGAVSTYESQTNKESASLQASEKTKSQTSESANWGFYNNWSDQYGTVTTTGSVTQYYDNQVPATAEASIGNGALSGATGNVGVNITTGIDNAQSNNASLASIDAGKTFGNAQVFSSQTSEGKGTIDNYNLVASVGDKALQGATGNVGVNVSSGIGNVQNNSLALVSSTPSGKYSQGGAIVATDDSTQDANAQVTGTFNGSSTLGNNALNGATGNIGVNIATGGGNLQHNGLAVASVTH